MPSRRIAPETPRSGTAFTPSGLIAPICICMVSFGSHDMAVRDAIILAAGMGVRLRSLVDDRPKGLIEIGGETLVGRSVRLLREAGITQITIVTGHGAKRYERFAAGQPDIQLVLNERFATTGSMASLARALVAVERDVLVLESDLVYESRALNPLLIGGAADSTLASGPTAAGDEVWVYAPEGRLEVLSKNAHELPAISGEFVGITRLSWTAGQAMLHAFEEFVRTRGHGRMDYETGALAAVARSLPITVPLIADLCWGEIDDEGQFERVINRVWPIVSAEGIQEL
jgi:choline kinase